MEIFWCPDTPYTCDGFDPADWPDGEVPDLSRFAFLSERP